MTLFDIVKAIYKKDCSDIVTEFFMCSTLMKWLSYDYDNIHRLKKIIQYIFFIEPENLYKLIYCSVPKKTKVPYLPKVVKQEVLEDKLFDKMMYVLGYSGNDIKANKKIIERIINQDRDYLMREFAVKK